MDPENEKFTAKEERFCYEYCIDFNATQAAIRAGYSVRTARSISSKLLTKVNIQAKIRGLKVNLSETAGIGALRIILEHAKIAFSDAGKLRDGWMELKEFEDLSPEDKACIQEISTKEEKKEFAGIITSVTWVKFKLYDKQKALDSLTNIFGYNAAIRNELTGKIEFGKLSEIELDQIIDKLMIIGNDKEKK